MTRRATDLEARLVEWGREYGGGRYEANGWPGFSPLLTLMTYHGRSPDGLNPKGGKDATPADEVQAAVVALASQQQGWRAANVINIEYTCPGKPIVAKLQILQVRKPPVQVSDASRYSQLLQVARIHVAAWLKIPFSGPLSDDQALRDVRQ